jgi:hypothetical protein
MRYVGGFGLSIDLAFHWSAADNPASPLGVLRELFVDTDPGSVWWLTALGVAAHVMFFGVFALMLLTGRTSEPPKQREDMSSRSAHAPTNPGVLEHLLQEHIAALGPGPRTELLNVLMLPDYQRVERIGGYYEDRRTRTLAQLLIELEESPHARAVVLGELQVRQMQPDR